MLGFFLSLIKLKKIKLSDIGRVLKTEIFEWKKKVNT